MNSLEQLTNWVQHRIDYYEDVVEKHSNDYDALKDNSETWIAGLERGEEIGMRDAFIMVMECINGQRR